MAEKKYKCRPVLILRGGQAFTPEGNEVSDPAGYFAGEPGKEAAIGLIRRCTAQNPFPVMAGGRTRRLEDVKKYIYAGARAAFLRADDADEMAVYEEAVRRFGKNRVALYSQEDSGEPGTVTVQEDDTDLSFDQFKRGPDGLLPCIVQDVHTGRVLMMAYMNEEAFRQTCRTGRMTYYSRSRRSLWLKGETSGHFQYVRSLSADCDWDTLLARVEQVGNACHTGAYSCFFRPLIEGGDGDGKEDALAKLERVIADRRACPKEGSYTNYLFEKGLDKILKKVGEEAAEIVIAAKNSDPEEVKYEAADFLYHLMVLLAEKGIAWSEVKDELSRR